MSPALDLPLAKQGQKLLEQHRTSTDIVASAPSQKLTIMKRAKDIVKNIAISNLHKYPEKNYEDALQLTLNMDHTSVNKWVILNVFILRSEIASSLSTFSQHCSSRCLSDVICHLFISPFLLVKFPSCGRDEMNL